MQKLINFCKKRYKVLIPVMVVFVLLITLYFLYREYKYDNYKNKKEISVYQYFGGIKNDYTAVVTYNIKDVIVDIKSKNGKIEYDSTPIYYSDSDDVLFPMEMSAIFPLKEGSQYRLYKYSSIKKNENINTITVGNTTNEYDYFFVYDGKGLFFFPDKVTINIDDKEYKNLGNMSYVQIIGGYTLTYYDKESDTSEVIEIENKKVTVTSDNINVNLSERYCLTFGKKVLLMNPHNLNALNN